MVLGHVRGCFNTGLHIVAPQRSEHVANEPVAAAERTPESLCVFRP
jgi:hypothetical protein